MDDDVNDQLLFQRIDLPVYKVVVPETKTVLVFQNGSKLCCLPAAATTDAAGGRITSQEAAKLAAIYGNDYMSMLGLDRAFQPDGARITKARWTFRAVPRIVFGHESVGSLQQKVAEALGVESGDVYMWTWSTAASDDAIRERLQLVSDVFMRNEMASVEQLERAVALRTSSSSSSHHRPPPEPKKKPPDSSKLTRKRAFERLDARAFSKVKATCGFRYSYGEMRAAGSTMIYPIDPADRPLTDDEYNAIRLSPMVRFVDERREKQIDALSPHANEIYCRVRDPKRDSDAYMKFAYPFSSSSSSSSTSASETYEKLLADVAAELEVPRTAFALRPVFVTDVAAYTPRTTLEPTNVPRLFRDVAVTEAVPVAYHNREWKILKSFAGDASASRTLDRVRRATFSVKPKDMIRWWSFAEATASVLEVVSSEGSSFSMTNMRSISPIDVVRILRDDIGVSDVKQMSYATRIKCKTPAAHNSIRDIVEASVGFVEIKAVDNAYRSVRFHFVDSPSTIVALTLEDSSDSKSKKPTYAIRIASVGHERPSAVFRRLQLTLRLVVVLLFSSLAKYSGEVVGSLSSPQQQVASSSSSSSSTPSRDRKADEEFLADYFKDVVDVESAVAESKGEDDDDVDVDAEEEEEERDPEEDDEDDDDGQDGVILSSLKKADRRLFAYPVIRPSHVKYSTLCHKHRQPVVVTADELKKFQAKKLGYGRTAIAYGSTAELAKTNRYICPTVWCPLSRTPMTMEEFQRHGKKCPTDGDVPIVRDSVMFTGYQNPDKHPDHLCIPCCFSKPKDHLLSRCAVAAASDDEDDDKDDAEAAAAAAAAAAAGTSSSYSKYIMSHDANLTKNRMGLLPEFLENVFGNVLTERGHRHDGTGFLKPTSRCFLRLGSDPGDAGQPFLSCMANALCHPQIAVADAAKLRSASAICDAVAQNLSVELFVSLADGTVLITFARTLAAGAAESVDIVRRLAEHPTYAKLYGLSDLSEDEQLREKVVFAAFDAFKRYMRDRAVAKTADVVGQLFNQTIPWLNSSHVRFVYVDRDEMTMTTLNDDTSNDVAFVLIQRASNKCELIGRARMKDKGPTVAFEYDDLPGTLYAFVRAPDVPGDAEALKQYQDVYAGGDVVRKFIVSYERSTIGFKTRKNGTIMLKSPASMFPVRLGQGYEYEKSDIDLQIFLENYVLRPMRSNESETDGSDPASERAAAAAAVRTLIEKISENDEIVRTVATLRNPLNPMPMDAKVPFLKRRLEATVPAAALEGADAALRTLLDPTVRGSLVDVYERIVERFVVPTDASSASSSNDAAAAVVRVTEDRYRNPSSSREFKARLQAEMDPFRDRARTGEMLVVAPVPRANQSSDALTAKRKKDADITGEFRPVGYKWRALMKRFDVLASSDTLWDIFERVAVILGRRQTFRGGEGLKTITTAFIANDPDLLSMVTETNSAMEYLKGFKNMGLVRSRVLSGSCPPSYIEICVLSRIVDVRTIILKRKTNNRDDDDGFLCMNSNPTTDPHPFTLIFQHKVTQNLVDDFKPMLYDRKTLVNTDEAFTPAFKELIEERCQCVSCWDEKCVTVIDEIARKKKSHEASLLRDTIRKMKRKQQKSWEQAENNHRRNAD